MLCPESIGHPLPMRLTEPSPTETMQLRMPYVFMVSASASFSEMPTGRDEDAVFKVPGVILAGRELFHDGVETGKCATSLLMSVNS